jgi:hypothetical protein
MTRATCEGNMSKQAPQGMKVCRILFVGGNLEGLTIETNVCNELARVGTKVEKSCVTPSPYVVVAVLS